MNACVDVDRQRRRFFKIQNRRFSTIIEKMRQPPPAELLINAKYGGIVYVHRFYKQ